MCKVLLANISSTAKKLEKLMTHCEIIAPKIILLNETHLNKTDELNKISTSHTHFKYNHHIYKGQNSEITTAKGIPPFIGSSIYTSLENSKFNTPFEDEEILTADIVTEYNIRYFIIHAYLSPSSSNSRVESFYSKIEKLLKSAPKDARVLCTGDWNSKNNKIYKTKSPNTAGDHLVKLINSEEPYKNDKMLTQIVKKPTRTTKTTKNLLDIVLVEERYSSKITVDHVGALSDHDLLQIDLNPQIKKPTQPQKRTRIFNFEQVEKEVLHQDLVSLYWEIKHDFDSKKEANRAEKIKNLDLTTKKIHIKLKEIYIKNIASKNVTVSCAYDKDSFYPAKLQKMLRKRRKLYDVLRNLDQNPREDERYKSLDSLCEKEIKDFKIKWMEDLQNCEYTTIKSFFGKCKILTEKNAEKNEFVILNKEGIPIAKHNLPNEMGRNYVSKIEKIRPKTVSNKFKKISVEKEGRPFHTNTYLIRDIIKSTNNKLSAGFDEISNKMLKTDPEGIAPVINILAEKIFELDHWPNQFKVSKAIPLHKSGPKNCIDNYRFIALLSCMSKIIEKIIQAQIVQHFEENKLFHPHQAGYRRGYSCQALTVELIEKLLQNQDKKTHHSITLYRLQNGFRPLICTKANH